MNISIRRMFAVVAAVATLAVFGTPVSAQSEYLTIGTAGSSGSWYAFGGALAKVLGDNVPDLQPRVEATKGGFANVDLLAKGELDVALVPPFAADDAVKAKGEYAGKANYPLKAGGWFGCCENILTVMVPKDSPVQTLMDFKGRQVNMGNPGSTNRFITYKVIDAIGLDPDSFTPLDIFIGPAVNRLKNRQIDAIWWNATTPHPALVDASVSLDLRVVPIEGEIADKIVNTYDWMSRTVLKAGTYSGMDKDVNTVVSGVTVVMHQNISVDLGYRLTKAVFENLEALRQIHPAFKAISLDTALNGVNIALHPGVAKYYEEKGIKGLAEHQKKYGKL